MRTKQDCIVRPNLSLSEIKMGKSKATMEWEQNRLKLMMRADMAKAKLGDEK